ncbi:7410_t:CDS:2 [Dentiscutata heterogama]|uniref:7410_t:CDS:1 n=1 Tax=Dentiscutata heterogama TaxID=1316150 RepID=A0ACA9LY93_9GLOM|nr:7410_t:CDS:2 [Dentiscutata heterogama]
MPSYQLSTIVFIVLQFVSIFLLGVLVFALLTSSSQFTHSTLLQLFISALFFDSIGMLPVLMFGDDLSTVGIHSLLCKISQKITSFLFFPTHVFPLVIVSIIIDANIDNFGTTVSLYMCIPVFNDRTYYGYVIPNLVLTGLSIPMSCHSGFILWRRWKTFSYHQNRSTAIKLGHSVRLCVFSSISTIFLLATLIPRMMIYHKGSPVSQYILAFSTALLGVLLFLVFGSNSKAAIFLPCCYYNPPTLPTQILSSSPNYSEQNDHELRAFTSVTVNFPENSYKTDTYMF